MGLSGFGKKGIETRNTVEKENVDVIHLNYMGFKVSKNLLVFKINNVVFFWLSMRIYSQIILFGL